MTESQGESNNATATTPPPQPLLERLKDYGQEDAFALWDELSLEERDLLVKDIESLDLPRIDRIIRCSLRSQGLPAAAIEPVPESSVSTVEERNLEERERWWKMGLKAISDGKVAVLLLSGGQEAWFDPECIGLFQAALQELGSEVQTQKGVSRDGVDLGNGRDTGDQYPASPFSLLPIKKSYIGLPSGKSLFQLQAERILCLQRLAAQATNEGSSGSVQIHWYIMTSPFTDDTTRKYFESHKFFGLEPDQVTFFQQGTIPCVSKDSRLIMETPYRVAKAPDGNGGVYSALKSSRLLEDMAVRGIKYVDCYGVDNALAYPQEKVGVFVRRGKGGPLTVVEYSELDSSLASAINQETGRLRFCWSNVMSVATLIDLMTTLKSSTLRISHGIVIHVCLHMFSLDFLNQVANGLEKDSIYHLAEKKIPSIHGHTMGYKLEQFIFDAFPYAPSTALFEVLREEEFAPVKNANGSNFDTPDSARLLVLRLHSRWVVAAGGFLTHSVPLYATGVEVSPLCSYAGENLEAICRGRTFHAPCEITF
uniref:UDP-N-acetylglucosamine diphosphorylase n=1 Tax=Fagus sylvatica TaxID=28930 RepID=A0A2N9IW48_FAGSY